MLKYHELIEKLKDVISQEMPIKKYLIKILLVLLESTMLTLENKKQENQYHIKI